MTLRLPLPTRIQLQSVDGLRNAIIGGSDSVANDVVTQTTVDGYIHAFEDDVLAPLRLIWMRNTDYNITLDQYGRFDLRLLSKTVLEVVTIFSQASVTGAANNTYWQYEIPFDRKDLNTFKKLQGNVNIEPIYTIDQSFVKVWPPVNYYGPVCCEYYSDWPRLGDLSTNSAVAQYTLTITGTASADALFTFTSTPTSSSSAVYNTAYTSISIPTGTSAAQAATLVLATPIAFGIDSGNNPLYWITKAGPAPGTVVFIAPAYVNITEFTLANTSTLNASVQQTVAPLQAYITNNWFLDNYPYLYYFGALKHVFYYLNDLERLAWADKQVTKYVGELQTFSDRADVSDPSDGFNYNQGVQW